MRLSREAWASGRGKLFVVSLVAQDRSTESTELRLAQSLGASGARASSNYANAYTYTGRRWDADLSLYYFRARFYSLTLGRFISHGPLGFVDGMSLYRAYFLPGTLDPYGLACAIQNVEATLREKKWDLANATIKCASDVRGKVKICPVRCQDGSTGKNVTGTVAIRGKFELALASHRIHQWYPSMSCNKAMCSIRGPMNYQISGYYKLRAKILGRGISLTGGIETDVPVGSFGSSFKNPVVGLL